LIHAAPERLNGVVFIEDLSRQREEAILQGLKPVVFSIVYGPTKQLAEKVERG
jgi:hypothetical protein